MKVILWSALAIAALVAVVAGGYFIQYITADGRGAVAQQELVRADGNFRLQSYNHFFDLCSAIQTDEARIAALEASREAADSTVEKNRIRLTLPALIASRAGKINQYNVDAAKEGSVGIFRSNKLPYYIDPNGRNTQCVVV